MIYCDIIGLNWYNKENVKKQQILTQTKGNHPKSSLPEQATK